MTSLTSFEVIPQDTYDEQQENSLCSEYTFIQDVAIPVIANKYDCNGKSPLSSDIISEELSMHLGELIEENNKLKEKLGNNNKVMIEQLEKILALERLMEQNTNKHRSMFVDEVGHSKKLESEKEELSKKVEELQTSVKVLESSNASQNAKLQELEGEVAAKNAEIENLNKMLIEQQKAHQEFIDGVQEMRCNFCKGEEHLQDNETKRHYMSESFDNIDIFTDPENGYAVVHQVDSNFTNDQIKRLVRLLAEKDEKIQVLNETTSKLISEVEKNAALKLQLEEMIESFPAVYTRSSNARNVAELQPEADQNVVEDPELEKFGRFFSNMKLFSAELTKTNSSHESASEELAEAFEKVNQLTEENQKLKKSLDQTELEIKHQSEEMDNATSTEKEHLSQIDVLTAKLLTVEQELDAAQNEVNSLKRQLDTGENSNELLQILKAQVELYKSDYELEKAAYECSQKVVEELTEKVHNLELQIEDQLPTESRRHRKKGHGRRHSNEAKEESGMDSASALYTCPCCSLTFTVLNALENHVRDCLDAQQ